MRPKQIHPDRLLTVAVACFIGFLICVVLFLSAGCSASRTGRVMNGAVIGSGIADIVTTRQAIARGGYEVNPLMQGGVWRQSLIKFVGVSGVIAGAQIVERKKPVLAHILRGLVIGMQGWAAWHNTKVGR